MGRYYITTVLILMFLITGVSGTRILLVQSGSMKPSFDKGDFIVVIPAMLVKEGDIVSFQQKETAITHRITGVEKNEDGTLFHTKGDNNKDLDPFKVSEKEIIGKVLFVVPSHNLLKISHIPIVYWGVGFVAGALLGTIRFKRGE